jgi:hypothetical protein
VGTVADLPIAGLNVTPKVQDAPSGSQVQPVSMSLQPQPLAFEAAGDTHDNFHFGFGIIIFR